MYSLNRLMAKSYVRYGAYEVSAGISFKLLCRCGSCQSVQTYGTVTVEIFSRDINFSVLYDLRMPNITENRMLFLLIGIKKDTDLSIEKGVISED